MVLGLKSGIELLLDGPLQAARQELAERYATPEQLRANTQDALRLPIAARFVDDLAFLVWQSEKLGELIGGKHGLIIKSCEKGNAQLEQAWQVTATCYDHRIPKVAAIASIPAFDGETIEEAQARVNGIRFSHADLTHSYHSEKIDATGRTHCGVHGPATLGVTAKVYRLLQRPKSRPSEIEEQFIQELASRLYHLNGDSEKRERILQQVRENLNIVFRVGRNGIYGSLYEAMEQTRHRAVTAAHIAKNADLYRLNPQFREFAHYDAHASSPQYLAQQMEESTLFKAIEEVAKKLIPSPLIVVQQRTKGQSLVDKVTVREHYSELLDSFKNKTLQKFYSTLGIPIPEEMKQSLPNIDDIVGVQALVHSEDTYDFSQPAALRTEMPPQILAMVKAESYRILNAIAEIPEELRGYKRPEPPCGPNGKKNGARMPADRKSYKFKALGMHETSKGLVFNFDPEADKFDDYYVSPKGTGYMALQAAVGTIDPELEGAVIELKIKPNRVENEEKFATDRSHEAYKLQRAAQIAFLQHQGIVTPIEWEANKLLLLPLSGGTYLETRIVAAKSDGRSNSYMRRLVASK